VRAAIYLSMWRDNAVAHAASFRSAERGRLWQRITCKGLISKAGATQAPLRVIGPGNAPVSGAVMAVMVCWPERFRPMNPRFSGRADLVPGVGRHYLTKPWLPISLGPWAPCFVQTYFFFGCPRLLGLLSPVDLAPPPSGLEIMELPQNLPVWREQALKGASARARIAEHDPWRFVLRGRELGYRVGREL
jgi:hypothetical protein